MTREEHLEFCKTCRNKKLDIHRGIVCSITNEIADFDESCPDYSKVERTNYLDTKKSNSKLKREAQRNAVREERKKNKEKISSHDLLLILSGSMFAVFFNRLLVYIDYVESNLLLRFSYFIPILLFFAIIQFIRKRNKKLVGFFSDFKFRLLYTCFVSVILVSYNLVLLGYHSDVISSFIGMLIIVFILTYTCYFFVKPLFLLFKKDIILFKNSNKVILLSFSLILFLLLLQKDFLIKRETFYWKSDNSMQWNNFRGYPNYLSRFGAAILSNLEYDIKGDSIIIKAYSEPHHSWVRKSNKSSDYLLKHENYHFNISEIMARKFREEVYELSEKSRNKLTLERIFEKYQTELAQAQSKYDKDTEHGLLYEKQKDWEFLVDSLLRRYEIYSNPVMLSNHKSKPSNYYRQIGFDPVYNIVGKFAMDSVTALKTNHYFFEYKDGDLIGIMYKKRNKLIKDNYFGVCVIKISTDNENSLYQFYDSGNNRTSNNKNIHQIKIDRDASKNIIVKSYLDKEGKIIDNNMGVARVVWELDHKSRREIGYIYNSKNIRITDKEGNYTIKLKYDNNNHISERANYNKENKLLNDVEGIAVIQYKNDLYDNIIHMKTFNSDMKPVPYEGSISEGRYCYDIQGRIISESFYNADGTPHLNENNEFIFHYKYDQYSNLIEESRYGVNKNLKIDDNGLGKIKRKFDNQGNTIEAVNYDSYDNYLNDVNGSSKMLFEYDSLDRTTLQIEFTVDSLNNLKHSRTIKFDYDNKNNIIGESYYNEFDSLVSDSGKACIVRYEYDKHSNLLKTENLDRDSVPIAVTEGISIFRYEYDKRKNKTLAAYYNVNDELTNAKDGISYDRYFYNNRNQVIERRYFDSDHNLTKNSSGVEIIKWTRDKNNNVLEERYFDAQEQILEDLDGVALMKFYYDENNNRIKSEYYNQNLELVKNNYNGKAIVKDKFNNRNQLIETSFYNYKNELIETPDGYAIEKQFYDKYGRIIRREYLDRFKHLKVCNEGYASINWIYDRNDNVVAVVYKDENEQLIEDKKGYAIYNWIHDRNGDVIESYGFNADNANLENINYGSFISSVKSIKYNSNDYFVHNNNTRIQSTYHDNGNIESEAHYIYGKLDGAYKTWYETGELESEIMYENGMRIGKMIEYYKSGQVRKTMTYENNSLINSSVITYYENGKVHTIYLEDKLMEYDIHGNLIKEEPIIYN